ncbi:MAG TPA: hypothetical protein VFB81_06815 [Myxococcales bacterium]|nr:hypothetical protein [Myxococcales bacterium]
MNHQAYERGLETTPAGAEPPQSTVFFRRPCFQIAVHDSGSGATLGVRVMAAPAQHQG